MTSTMQPRSILSWTFLQRVSLLLVVFMAAIPAAWAQTVWTGNANTNWNNASNWSNGVPDIATEAIIPNVSSNDPVIENGQSVVAYAVHVEVESSLTISGGGILTINGSATYAVPFEFTAGLNNKGIVSNSGQLILGASSSVGSYAIINQGVFDNMTGATIRIDNSSDTGLYNASGTFTNHADIIIGSNTAIGLNGIWNNAVFENNTGGTISIDRSSTKALVNNLDQSKFIHATFTNAAAIIIGSMAGAGIYGIYNMGAFENNAGGAIQVDNTTKIAIYNDKDTFTNAANITIGSLAAAGQIGLDSHGAFTNTTGATLKIDRVTDLGINIGANVLTNNGTITLGAVGKPGTTGLRNANATFLNTGTISIDRTGNQGLETSGTTTNDGTITIGGSEAVGRFGLIASGSFTNNNGAVIRIDRIDGPASAFPTALRHQSGTFNNLGEIVIGESISGGDYGMRLQAAFTNNTGGSISIDRTNMTGIDNASTFINASNITIGALASVGKYGIDLRGQFTNNPGGDIRIDQSTEAAIFSKSSFINNADITIGASASAGKYGIETGGSGNFSNAPGGTISIDRSSNIAIAHLGGTFDNESEITIGGVTDAGIYGISNQKDFNNNPGGHIRIDRTTDTGIYQLKGTFTNAADITIGANADIGLHGIFNETIFNNNAGGNIRIDRTSLAGFRLFNGTFTNEAILTIGSVASVGTYGILNVSFLVNKTGGHIRIERSTDTGIYQFKGTLTNAASITIGANTSSGVHGIFNESEFVNNSGGDIRIDRTTLAALRNFNGTFTNAATITIGAIASAGSYGIRNQTAFANNAGGDIRIDRAVEGIFLENNNFTNVGEVTIGGVNAISNLLTQQGTGVFLNNPDGVFKGSGQIIAASFINAGGTLSPGYSPGNLTFSGSKDFSNSVMDIELNGADVTQYDRIGVTGDATLGGSLALSINYTPANGDEMTIITATSIAGTFSTITGMPDGWTIVYESNTVKMRYDKPLPVVLISFNAKAVGAVIKLDWRTASEVDNAGFYIERSANGFTWKDIGFVDGNATTSGVKYYAFGDETPMPGINYYRLRQIDFDGKTEYSRLQSVRFIDPQQTVTVWADATKWAHIQTNNTIGQVTVYDLSGRVLMVSKEATLNLSGVPSGVVLIHVKTDGPTVVRKLILY
jgi:hypothetical protein